MIDCGFPHLRYEKNNSYQQWGHNHGEEYAQAIQELATIRKELMLAKNPKLKKNLHSLAMEQFTIGQKYHLGLSEELMAIAQASGAPLTDLIILNNYTDFRDIKLDDQGCTTIGVSRDEKLSGQTWDMHSSAKNYLCSIELPNGTHLLSLVGCLGMMGVNSKGLFIGVNNLNTKDARPGVPWPLLVRSLLEKNTLSELENDLISAPVTSGHNYLISNGDHWKHLEISPTIKSVASSLQGSNSGAIYHTNHCLTQESLKIEDDISVNSTTFDRYKLCQALTPSIQKQEDLYAFLTSHEGYPKSICSHFQSGAQDPSTTCGGSLYNHDTREILMWRGCPHEDSNYAQRKRQVPHE